MVKFLFLFGVFAAFAFDGICSGGIQPLENFAPLLSKSTQLIWKVPSSTALPTNLWVYLRQGPKLFPANVISNALALASLQNKGSPKFPLKDYIIWEDRGPNYPGPIPSIFWIRPGYATISYSMPNYDSGSWAEFPDDGAIVRRAWNEASHLGLSTNQLRLKSISSHFRRVDDGTNITHVLCGRNVYLSRVLDGILFMGFEDQSWNEGFMIEFGSQGKVRSFSLNWPSLGRYKKHKTASLKEIEECIWGRKVIVLPYHDEERYFERIRGLANAKRFIITKIMPCYGEGTFGETQTDNEPSKFITPFAELEATANFGTSNSPVLFVSPILSSEVTRLLKQHASGSRQEDSAPNNRNP